MPRVPRKRTDRWGRTSTLSVNSARGAVVEAPPRPGRHSSSGARNIPVNPASRDDSENGEDDEMEIDGDSHTSSPKNISVASSSDSDDGDDERESEDGPAESDDEDDHSESEDDNGDDEGGDDDNESINSGDEDEDSDEESEDQEVGGDDDDEEGKVSDEEQGGHEDEYEEEEDGGSSDEEEDEDEEEEEEAGGSSDEEEEEDEEEEAGGSSDEEEDADREEEEGGDDNCVSLRSMGSCAPRLNNDNTDDEDTSSANDSLLDEEALEARDSGERAIGGQRTLLQPRKVVTEEPRPHPTSIYKAYRKDVERGLTRVYRIDTRTWAHEVYESGKTHNRPVVKMWTYVRKFSPALEQSHFTCSNCSDFRLFKTCVHVLHTKDKKAQALEPVSATDYPLAQPFHWVPPTATRKGVLVVACLPVGATKDVFIAWTGKLNHGAWQCSADRRSGGETCEHVEAAKILGVLPKLLANVEPFSEDDIASEDERASEDEALGGLPAAQAKREQRSAQSKDDERSISYKPVGPPPFCRIASDTEPWYPTVTPLPDYFPLPEDARCICGAPPDDTAPKKILANAFIYSSFGAKKVQIEVQACSKCPTSRHQYAGPDLREMGLFNFKNSSIFTHELLNSYMGRFFCHPAPFDAFCRSVRFDYQNHLSTHPFASNDLFRSAWFSWTRIIQLFGTEAAQCQTCPDCGSEPEICIVDAKTMGFQQQHVTSSLTPPTEVLPGAPERENVRRLPKTSACVLSSIRHKARNLCRWRASLRQPVKSRVGKTARNLDDFDVADADADEAGAAEQGRMKQNARDKAEKDYMASMPAVVRELKKESEALGQFFDQHVNTKWEKRKEADRRPFFALLEQVLAHGSVLQFAPASSWDGLGMLVNGNPDCINELLREIPALGVAALQDKMNNGETFSKEIRKLAAFIRRRANRVMRALLKGNEHDDEATPAIPPHGTLDDWRETGQRYSGPIYRLRPSYPHLKLDSSTDRGVVNDAKSIGCNKYYQSYGKRGLTGGIFAVWCPHLICVGWHCIPRGEGRNDAFSAIFTRWKKTPKVIVYDFACALAPYAMLREPLFFKNTRFLIDDFHSKGHTRCTPACMLKTYRKHNADVTTTNSSAAECGNSALNRIEKSVSFMSQRHAVVYTGVFLEIWNRTRTIHREKRNLEKIPEQALLDELLYSDGEDQ